MPPHTDAASPATHGADADCVSPGAVTATSPAVWHRVPEPSDQVHAMAAMAERPVRMVMGLSASGWRCTEVVMDVPPADRSSRPIGPETVHGAPILISSMEPVTSVPEIVGRPSRGNSAVEWQPAGAGADVAGPCPTPG